MEDALGSAYSESWARQFVMSELGGRTAQDALDAGVPPKQVWAAVWRALDLPASEVRLPHSDLAALGVSLVIEHLFGLVSLHRCDARAASPQPDDR